MADESELPRVHTGKILRLKLDITDELVESCKKKLSNDDRNQQNQQITAVRREVPHQVSLSKAPLDRLKRKECNLQACQIRIGTWEFTSKREGDFMVKLYLRKRKLVWEFLQEGMMSRMELAWSNIRYIRPSFGVGDQPDSLEIELSEPPVFATETDSRPRKNTNWGPSEDFTGGQASEFRKHRVFFAVGTLRGPYERLMQSDERLSELDKQSSQSSARSSNMSRFPNMGSFCFNSTECGPSGNVPDINGLVTPNQDSPSGNVPNFDPLRNSGPSHLQQNLNVACPSSSPSGHVPNFDPFTDPGRCNLQQTLNVAYPSSEPQHFTCFPLSTGQGMDNEASMPRPVCNGRANVPNNIHETLDYINKSLFSQRTLPQVYAPQGSMEFQGPSTSHPTQGNNMNMMEQDYDSNSQFNNTWMPNSQIEHYRERSFVQATSASYENNSGTSNDSEMENWQYMNTNLVAIPQGNDIYVVPHLMSNPDPIDDHQTSDFDMDLFIADREATSSSLPHANSYKNTNLVAMQQGNDISVDPHLTSNNAETENWQDMITNQLVAMQQGNDISVDPHLTNNNAETEKWQDMITNQLVGIQQGNDISAVPHLMSNPPMDHHQTSDFDMDSLKKLLEA